jgi:hypothetical protein
MKKASCTQLPEQPLAHQVLYNLTGYQVGKCRNRKSLNTDFRLPYPAYLEAGVTPVNEEELFYDEYDFLSIANGERFSNPEGWDEPLLDRWSREFHRIIQDCLFKNNKASEIQRPSITRRVQDSRAIYRSSNNWQSKGN